MASLYRGDPAGPVPIVRGPVCGGALVAPTIVISAHHCILDLIDPALSSLPADPAGLGLGVMLGSNRLSGDGEKTRVKAFHLPPIANTDVLIVELYESSEQPVLAFATPSDVALYPPGSMATIIGWGLREEAPLGLPGALISGILGGGSDELLEAEIPIISDAACEAAWGPEFYGPTMLCAGYPSQGGVDTCQGDSGGPILTRRPDGSFLSIGTTWFGNGCARRGRQGVYAELAAVSDFIASWTG